MFSNWYTRLWGRALRPYADALSARDSKTSGTLSVVSWNSVKGTLTTEEVPCRHVLWTVRRKIHLYLRTTLNRSFRRLVVIKCYSFDIIVSFGDVTFRSTFQSRIISALFLFLLLYMTFITLSKCFRKLIRAYIKLIMRKEVACAVNILNTWRLDETSETAVCYQFYLFFPPRLIFNSAFFYC